LRKGDRVIVYRQHFLQEGDPVRVTRTLAQATVDESVL